MEVRVYWNARKKVFSVKHKGKVIGHARRVMIRGVDFLVSQAGRERVLREKAKNVHAYVSGVLEGCEWIDQPGYGKPGQYVTWDKSDKVYAKIARKRLGVPVTYNPRTMTEFHALSVVGVPCGPMHSAEMAYLFVEDFETKWAKAAMLAFDPCDMTEAEVAEMPK